MPCYFFLFFRALIFVVVYRDHVKELKSAMPTEPVIFLKPPSSYIFNGQTALVYYHSCLSQNPNSFLYYQLYVDPTWQHWNRARGGARTRHWRSPHSWQTRPNEMCGRVRCRGRSYGAETPARPTGEKASVGLSQRFRHIVPYWRVCRQVRHLEIIKFYYILLYCSLLFIYNI